LTHQASKGVLKLVLRIGGAGGIACQFHT
jgi:hypothetical protein